MSLIADVFDITLQTDGGDLIASTTLQSADVAIAVDEQEVRGGKGDALLAVLHSARRVDISVSEITFQWDWVANQLGKTAKSGATTAWAMPKFYTAVDLDAEGAGTAIGFTLDEEPLATGSGLKIFNAGTKAAVATPAGYTISGKVVTIVGGTAGTVYEVRGYKYTTSASASTIEIDNTSFADGVVCVLTTLEIDEDESPINLVQIQLDEVLPSGNFTIATTSQRQASATNFTFKAIKPNTATTLGRIVRIPISAS